MITYYFKGKPSSLITFLDQRGFSYTVQVTRMHGKKTNRVIFHRDSQAAYMKMAFGQPNGILDFKPDKPAPPLKTKRYEGVLTLTHKGVTRTVTEWSASTGLSIGTIYQRKSKGWSDERCLEPRGKAGRPKGESK